MTKTINWYHNISYPQHKLYLFRSKIGCYAQQNAVSQSILLVDFDYGTSVESVGGKKVRYPPSQLIMF
jgi:hypothetical protein